MNPVLSSFTERLQQCAAIGFDFDGTLVDSNRIKRGAFDLCFADYPEHAAAIHEYCSRFNHTPRWEKFRYVIETIVGKPYTTDVATTLHARYETATTQQVIAAPEIPGANAFLKKIAGIPLLLLSSTPEPILKTILDQRGMTSLFTMIRGAPLDKAAVLKDYQDVHKLGADGLLFFGDTPEDAAAAKVAGWPFVGIANSDLKAAGEFCFDDYRALA